MKKIEKISDQFGLTQNDLALLLRVSRSQLSMYEIGQRDLPVAAKEQLVEMLTFIQKNPLQLTTSNAVLKEREEQRKKVLQDLIIVNKHQQLMLDKKINALERKQHAILKSMQLVAFLEMQSTDKGLQDNPVAKLFKMKATSGVAKSGLITLTKLQLKKEVLQAEQQLLENFMQKDS
jgi:transcriptional regulator with XRE-family HTH domain